MDDPRFGDRAARGERFTAGHAHPHQFSFLSQMHTQRRPADDGGAPADAFASGVRRFTEVGSDEPHDEASFVRAEAAEHRAAAAAGSSERQQQAHALHSFLPGMFLRAHEGPGGHYEGPGGIHARIVPVDDEAPPPPQQPPGGTPTKRNRGGHNRKERRGLEKAQQKRAKADEAQQRSADSVRRRAETRNKGKQPAAAAAAAESAEAHAAPRPEAMSFDMLQAKLRAHGFVSTTETDALSAAFESVQGQERELWEHQAHFSREAARVLHGESPTRVWTSANSASGGSAGSGEAALPHPARNIHEPGLDQQQSVLRAIQLAQAHQQASTLHAVQLARMAELAALSGLTKGDDSPVAEDSPVASESEKDDAERGPDAANVAETRSSTPSVRLEALHLEARDAPASGDEDAASSKASGAGEAASEVALTPEERERARRAAKRSRQKKKEREGKKAQTQANKAAKTNDKIVSRASRKKAAPQNGAQKPAAASPELAAGEQQSEHAAPSSPPGSSRASTPTKLDVLSIFDRPAAATPPPREPEQSSTTAAKHDAPGSDPASEVSVRSPKGGLKGALTAPSTPANWSVHVLDVDTLDVPELDALAPELSHAAALDLAYEEPFAPHERIRGNPLRAARSFRKVLSDSARGEDDDDDVELELAFLESCAAASALKSLPQAEPTPETGNAAEQHGETTASLASASNGTQHAVDDVEGIAAPESTVSNCSIGSADEAIEACAMPLPPSSPSEGSLGSPTSPSPASLSLLPPLPPSPTPSNGSDARSAADVEALPSPDMSRPTASFLGGEALHTSGLHDADAQDTPSEADSGDEADLDSDDGQEHEQGSVSVHFEPASSDDEEDASGRESVAEQRHAALAEATEEELIWAEAVRLHAASRGLFSALYQQGLRTAELPSPAFVGSFSFELLNRHGDADFLGLNVNLAADSLHEAFEQETDSEESQSSPDERVDDDSSSEADFRLPRGISTSTIAHTTPGGSPESTRGRKRGSKLLTGAEVPLEAAYEDSASAGHATPGDSQTESSSETIEGDSASESEDEPLSAATPATGRVTGGQVVARPGQLDQRAAEQRARYMAEQLGMPLDRSLVRRTGSVHEQGGGPLQLFGSRWRSGKLREKIHSNRPDPENLTRNDARNAEGQLINPTVLNEVAPLRLHSGGEHKYLPRPKVAKNLLSRQVGVRLPETEPAADRLRLMLCSTATQRGRTARPWAASSATSTPPAIDSPPAQALIADRPPEAPVQVGAGLDQLD